MDVYHRTSGWEVIVVNSSIATGLPIVEVYVVALHDQEEARAKISSFIGESGIIKEMTRIAANRMESYQLMPGRWLRIAGNRMNQM
jgi:hypothetical protein